MAVVKAEPLATRTRLDDRYGHPEQVPKGRAGMVDPASIHPRDELRAFMLEPRGWMPLSMGSTMSLHVAATSLRASFEPCPTVMR